MVTTKFSTSWIRSKQARKQRKYRYNAPLHIQQKFVSVHLSPVLRKKQGQRNIIVKKGDKVKILRGQFKKKEGKVERVNLKRGTIYVAGIEQIRKEGTKVLRPLNPSNLMIIELDASGKKRSFKTARKKESKHLLASQQIATNQKKELKKEKTE